MSCQAGIKRIMRECWRSPRDIFLNSTQLQTKLSRRIGLRKFFKDLSSAADKFRSAAGENFGIQGIVYAIFY